VVIDVRVMGNFVTVAVKVEGRLVFLLGLMLRNKKVVVTPGMLAYGRR
jgi:hypothetical protein